MDHTSSSPLLPHVVIFPLPIQGPIKAMIKLAELLCVAGIKVTFLNTNHSHRLLVNSSNIELSFSRYKNFTFQTISDGLLDDKPRSRDRFMELCESLESVSGPLFREMLISGCLSTGPPVTCIIADACLGFPLTVAEEVGIPLLYCETMSPCCIWTCFSAQRLIDAGEIPFIGNDLDQPIKSVPGMENFLRRRDLPSCYRVNDINHTEVKMLLEGNNFIGRCHGLIVNTFKGLDEPVLSHIQSCCRKLYPIGPLHADNKARLGLETSSSTSLWKEEKSCITWLDSQPSKSVIYFSIGSLSLMTEFQLVEFWHGLVNSGKRFLWVRRPGSDVSGFTVPHVSAEVLAATKERGFVVSWAPQEEVLAHRAIGGLLTHSGWNSTLESIVEGVPMLCWPNDWDQLVNARFVSEVWKIGIDMKDTCDRDLITKYIKELMDDDVKRHGFVQRANELAKLARESVDEGGSSFCSLNSLIEDIKSMA